MVYYIMFRGQVTGPMNKDQIFAYPVNRETMISADGGDWRPLYTYPDLMAMLNRTYGQPFATAGVSADGCGYQRQVSFGEAISRGFKNYATFTGRASRSEYWWWQLFLFIIQMVLSFFTMVSVNTNELLYDPLAVYTSPGYILSMIVSLVLFLPNLGVFVRRMHDTGRSGWWWLLNLLCCIGSIILLVWCCQPSQEEHNDYGPVPNVEL